MSTDYNYNRFTPLDNTGDAYNVFRSAYKNIRFAMPTVGTEVITEPDMANFAGLAFRIYGDESLWRALLAFNGCQDPIQDLWPGMVLKYPSKSALIAYLNAQTQAQRTTITI